jgi:UDP-2-acetamido-2,6-beta-L-arabino-hexul-4-ose reductase
MKRVGITGENGFIGSHLFNRLELYKDQYCLIHFEKYFFNNDKLLDDFVNNCDVIVHLAGLNRHEKSEIVYDANIFLAEKLKDSLIRTNSRIQVIFSSSLQEENETLYGKSKKDARNILKNWAYENGGSFTGLIIPNVFGPFGKPFYNSVVATFCYQLNNNEVPVINVDVDVKLIYVDELINEIVRIIDENSSNSQLLIPHTSIYKVSEILYKLESFKNIYLVNGVLPSFSSKFELNLFNTFRSFINLRDYFPVYYKNNIDERGVFTELIRLESGGQVSFSTTKPKVTRGNHFHTRKIERFSVIKGKALIQLRKVGSNELFEFVLDGDSPAYVDMPIWYTHNITNIGNDDLYTVFWINEVFDPADSDTYFQKV